MQSNVAELPVTDRLWAWFETNKKPVLIGTAVLIIAGLVLWFVVWQQDQREMAGSRALADVAAAQMTGAAARSDSAAAYLKVAANYPKSSAAARALLLAAGSLFTDGKYAEAQAQFERFLRSQPGSPFTPEALLGRGASLEAQGKTDDAITIYKDLVARHPNSSVIPEARLALGRLYETQGKPELARDSYEEAARSAAPYGGLASEAGVRLDELIAKHPNLAPNLPALPANPANAPLKLEKK